MRLCRVNKEWEKSGSCQPVDSVPDGPPEGAAHGKEWEKYGSCQPVDLVPNGPPEGAAHLQLAHLAAAMGGLVWTLVS